MKVRTRGFALANVLLLLLLLVPFVFLLVSQQTTFLNVAKSRANQQRAENLAFSALSRAVDRLADDHAFASGITVVPGELDPRGSASVAFDSPVFSTNNLSGDSSVVGYGGVVVPARSAHLVAVGRCASSEAVLSAIVTTPPFPYALASSGPLTTRGQTLVAGISSLSELGDLSELEEGAVASNVSLELLDETRVKGEAVSAGDVVIGSSAVVDKVRANVDPTALPAVDLLQYRPDGEGEAVWTSSFYPGLETLYGLNRWTSTSTGTVVFNGGLELDGALLWVDGDVIVNGPVVGSGAIVASGTVTFGSGAASLSADSLVAVLSGQGITVRGGGAGNSFFQGLLYAEGPVTVEDVTVVGAVVSEGASARLDVADARVVHSPEATKFEVLAGLPGGEIVESGVGGGGGAAISSPDYKVVFQGPGGELLEPTSANAESILELFQNPDGSYTWDPSKLVLCYDHDGDGTIAAPGEYLSFSGPSEIPTYFPQGAWFAYSGTFEKWKSLVNASNDTGASLKVFHLDFNEFLGVGERMKVESLRHLTF